MLNCKTEHISVPAEGIGTSKIALEDFNTGLVLELLSNVLSGTVSTEAFETRPGILGGGDTIS